MDPVMNQFVLSSFILIATIVIGGDAQGGRYYRISPDDTVYNCDRLPAKENFQNFLNLDKLLLEHIDENFLEIGGEIEMMYDFVLPNAPVKVFVKSEFLSQGAWVDGLLRYYTLNICNDFGRPDFPWYNLTNNWSKSQCPPHKGDIWKVERQTIELAVYLPQNMPIGRWRISYTVIQEGTKRSQFCFNLRFDLFRNE